MVHHLFALSTNAVLVLDQRTLQLKYRIPVSEVDQISLSPYNDSLVVFHVKRVILFLLCGFSLHLGRIFGGNGENESSFIYSSIKK